MLKYKQIHYTEILKKFPGFEDEIDLEDYLSSRPDVLENIDLFAPNCRTKEVENSFKDFKKVEKVDKDTVIVIGLYLEILIFGYKPQYMCYVIDYYCNLYKDNIVVAFYNHDNDFSVFNQFIKQYKNLKIINFNTSDKTSNDIVVPFFAINQESYDEAKSYNYGFVGNVTHPVRHDILKKFFHHKHFFNSNNVPPEDFYKTISSFVFNLCPRGCGLSSYRFFESMFCNTIPVLFTEKICLPYEEFLDYDTFSVFIKCGNVIDYPEVLKKLHSVDTNKLSINLNLNKKYFTLKYIQDYVAKNIKDTGNINT
tara:strand:- start:1063 stop:1992 length:930 start_codon:yes stop_codon:yes gene_type:complete